MFHGFIDLLFLSALVYSPYIFHYASQILRHFYFSHRTLFCDVFANVRICCDRYSRRCYYRCSIHQCGCWVWLRCYRDVSCIWLPDIIDREAHYIRTCSGIYHPDVRIYDRIF